MTEDKICPFMSRPDGTTNSDDSPRVAAAVYCQKDQCMAWGNQELYRDTTGAFMVKGCRLIRQ